MFSNHYIEWRKSRMYGIKRYIQPNFFNNKKLLELGCGYAELGNEFYKLCANVTSTDARIQHLKVVNSLYPHIRVRRLDCDKDIIQENYDIILHWGLLCHLNEIENHLEMVLSKCNILLLETEVCDSLDDNFYISVNEEGYDQAYNIKGIRPSPFYVEKIIKKNGFNLQLIDDPIINSEFHIYDWKHKNDNSFHPGLRRYWICWKNNISSPISMNNKIYFLCGGTRTFMDCFDSTYENIISKLFNNNNDVNTHVLLYLKCDDPGPKGQHNWDFTYENVDMDVLKNKIETYKKKYNNITFHSKILLTNEITDCELFSQIKNRKKYINFLNDNSKLLRALHCHYNIEQCGKIIEEIQINNNITFNYFIYIRPDLFFTSPCQDIIFYNNDKVIVGEGPNSYNIDHIAIIPKKYKNNFFFKRMELIRNNKNIFIDSAETLYLHTINNNYEIKNIGNYFIKRK
jgi:hypothetical protein